MAARIHSKRAVRAKKIEGGGSYFSAPKTDVKFISSGCATLDLALGGGWAEEKVINVVGDKSSGKTLIAIEAAANFAKKYPKGMIRYREAEAAFLPSYAEALGMPVGRVDFGEPIETIEDLFEDLTRTLEAAKTPELYIIDSLDALTDRAELLRDIDEGTYGANKPKQLSQMFRRLVRKMSSKRVTLMVISQVRSNIGISFGRGTTRSGGRALDFYASQVLYLTSGELESREYRGLKRVTGIDVRARVDKNKIALPFRDAEFKIVFGYGVDDVGSCLDWLRKTKFLPDVGISNTIKVADLKAIKRAYLSGEDAEDDPTPEEIRAAVTSRWYEVEDRFLPKKRKY